MNGVLERLRSLLGVDRCSPADPSPVEDICRYELGRPLAWVRPRDAPEVALVVGLCRELGVPLVPVGCRTSYWRSLELGGAIALDTAELRGVRAFDAADRWVTVGAATSVRDLDDWLRERGLRLALQPDAFGETSVGAMVAIDLAAGIGMVNGTAGDGRLLLGLEVVTGAGDIVLTGAANALGSTPFLRAGLPDPTGLFLASEGALGVVTAVTLRPWPLRPQAQLSWELQRSEAETAPALADLARRLEGTYETFRAATVHAPRAPARTRCDMVIFAASEPELDGRVQAASGAVSEAFGVSVAVERDASGRRRLPKWLGPRGVHAALGPLGHFVGVDVLVPYSELVTVMARADEILARGRELAYRELRRALYFAPGYINLGLHMMFAAEAGAICPGAHELADWGKARLADLKITPYRFGHSWAAHVADRVDPGYAALLRQLKTEVFDPDGVLAPGVSVF